MPYRCTQEGHIRSTRPSGKNVCKTCHNILNREANRKHPERNRARVRAWQIKYPEKHRAARRAFHKRNPDSGMRAHVKQRYGITLEQYRHLLSKPCAICTDASTDLDHNHQSKKARSGLCHTCNIGVGAFRENLTLLANAIEYLKFHAEIA
jgi:hypothetical protein